MAVTVAQVLHELPILSKARVVAGSSGLERVIRWTHIIDHPGAVSWMREGYLLVTTAFSLMLHPEEQIGLIRSLNDKLVAGMMVNTGQYMKDIPSEMVDEAETLSFPLITIPWEVDLAEVSRAIHEHILQEQYYFIEQADHIHKILTQLVLDGGDLLDLTHLLAKMLHCSVTIEDDALHLLARSSIEPTDEVRRRSIEQGKMPDNVVEYLRARGFFEHLRKNPRPYHVSPSPEIGFTLDRIVSPILVGSHLFGYIWIIASAQPLTDLDYLVIEHGAVVAALILSQQEAIYKTEQHIKIQLFEGTLDPPASFPFKGLDAALQTGLQNGYTLLVIEAGPLRSQAFRKLTTMVEQHMQSEGMWATAIERGQRLAVVLGTMEVEKLRTIAEQFLLVAAAKGFQIAAGISSPARKLEALHQVYQQAVDALEAAAALDHETHRVWAYDDLGFLAELISRSPEVQVSNRYTDILNKMMQFDLEQKTQYLITLEIYLKHLFNATQAAKRLHIHRNTLYQRLSKITDLWVIDFQDPLVMLNLNIAIKVFRLQQSR